MRRHPFRHPAIRTDPIASIRPAQNTNQQSPSQPKIRATKKVGASAIPLSKPTRSPNRPSRLPGTDPNALLRTPQWAPVHGTQTLPDQFQTYRIASIRLGTVETAPSQRPLSQPLHGQPRAATCLPVAPHYAAPVSAPSANPTFTPVSPISNTCVRAASTLIRIASPSATRVSAGTRATTW